MSEINDTDYACVLSGLLPNSDELVPEELVDEDLGDLPVGWTEVRLRRRVPNITYLEIQAVKRGMFEQELMKVPAEHRRDSAGVVRIQVDAMFAALEARTPAYEVDEEVVYVAPPTREAEAGGLSEAQMEIFQALDIDWIGVDDNDEGVPVVEPIPTSPPSPVVAAGAEVEAEAPAPVEEQAPSVPEAATA